MPRGKAKAKKTVTTTVISTPTVALSPTLRAIQQFSQNQTKILSLGEELAKVELRKAELEGQINVLLGTPAGTQISTSSPAATVKATGAKRGPKAAAAPAVASDSRRGPKTDNALGLGDTLYNILKDAEPMGINDLADAALKGGYQTKASNFGKVVRQSIDQDGRFRKVKTAGKRDVKVTIV